MAKRPVADTDAARAFRERRQRQEDLVDAWWQADAAQRDAVERVELARQTAQERVDECSLECDRLSGELIAAGLGLADVALLTGRSARALADIAKAPRRSRSVTDGQPTPARQPGAERG